MNQSKDTFYFPHDSNARHDPKIVALRSIYGYRGYGQYWAIIEILREHKNYSFPLDRFHRLALAKELEVDEKQLAKFLEDCVEIGLFQINNSDEKEYLICDQLMSRLKKFIERKKQAILAAETRWGKVKQKKEEPKKVTPPKKKSKNYDYKTPIELLNKLSNSQFSSSSQSTKDIIKARYNEGRTAEDFEKVIRVKCNQWKNDDKMNRYLRPSTLFNRKNFENYLNEALKGGDYATDDSELGQYL